MNVSLAEPIVSEQRVIMHGVSWQAYLALVEDSDRHECRICYDQGVMEIISPLYVHDNSGRIIGRMIEVFTEELQIPISSAKSTTFRLSEQERGFEADESYYIANESRIRGLSRIDLEQYPPPDLVIEIDISRSSMEKFAIFGGLGVPEVWRYDGEKLTVYSHESDDVYLEQAESIVLKSFPINEVSELIQQCIQLDETSAIRAFRKSVIERFET